MLKKIVVALVAATMLTAPALAQGGGAPQATTQGSVKHVRHILHG